MLTERGHLKLFDKPFKKQYRANQRHLFDQQWHLLATAPILMAQWEWTHTDDTEYEPRHSGPMRMNWGDVRWFCWNTPTGLRANESDGRRIPFLLVLLLLQGLDLVFLAVLFDLRGMQLKHHRQVVQLLHKTRAQWHGQVARVRTQSPKWEWVHITFRGWCVFGGMTCTHISRGRGRGMSKTTLHPTAQADTSNTHRRC